MIQLKLTDKQFRDLFNGLFEAEKSLEHLAIDAKSCLGAVWIFEEASQESLRYKELRRFISENREVL